MVKLVSRVTVNHLFQVRSLVPEPTEERIKKMNKIRWLIIPALIGGFLFLSPTNIKADSEDYLTQSVEIVAGRLDRWLRLIIWDDNLSLDSQLRATELWIEIQKLNPDHNSSLALKEIPSNWTKMGGKNQ